MELARHSDLKLTMKNYTDAGQLPLQEVMDTLPGFGADTRMDSRNLVAACPSVSPADAVTETIKEEKSAANIGESHGLSLSVAASPQNGEWRREGDSNALKTALRFRVTDCDSRSQVVTSAFVCNDFFGFCLPCFGDGT